MKNILTCIALISITQMAFSQANPIAREIPKDTAKYSIENCVNEFSMEGTKETSVGYQHWFVPKEFANGQTLKMSVVAPGKATHPPHKHSEEEFFFVLEGTAEFFLDGKTKQAGAYASFYCPSFSMHGIRNVGDVELKYLVIKKYEKK